MSGNKHPIVIIGPAADPHVQAVTGRLAELGHTATNLDSSEFPDTLSLSLGDAMDGISVAGERLIPAAVYIRNLGLTPIGATASAASQMQEEVAADFRRTMLALRERSDLISSLVHRWEALGVPIYNPQSVRHRITKPFQLGLLAQAGLPVPDSLWSNEPAAVRRFAEGRRVAYKPVAGGASTKELKESDLTDHRLGLLSAAPVCFQELLPGDDIRVYLIDGKIVCGVRIVTDAIDFRQNEKSLDQFPVTDELADVCRRALEVIGLRFTGMDLKGDVNGTLKILELNPSPMFLGFDARAGTDILGALAEALAAHAT